MNTQKVGFGIIGAGMIADLHARAISQLNNTTLVGVFDLNMESARKLAAKFNCRCYFSSDKFIIQRRIFLPYFFIILSQIILIIKF